MYSVQYDQKYVTSMAEPYGRAVREPTGSDSEALSAFKP